MASLRWTVSQIGARQHYGVPRGFHYQSNLRAFYTESWCRWGISILSHGPAKLRAFAGRFSPDLPSELVVDYTIRTERDRLQNARHRATSTPGVYTEFLRFGDLFDEWVAEDLSEQTFDPEVDCFFGFDTGCLRTLKLMRERGILTIVDQIDPARMEEDMVIAEAQKWPGWEETTGRIPDAYFERLAAEWEVASLIVVNSEWSKTALVAQGVPAEKLLVVPVAYESQISPPSRDYRQVKPLTVLWLGTVNLRKGIPYLIEAARMLQKTNIQFKIAGPIQISREAIASAPSNVSFLGRLNRIETSRYYQEADIFVLPTISDGFAITQIEAMAHGLPVITTPNCGQVVTHGIDGLIVNVADARALAEAIATLDADRELRADMSKQALVRAQTFQLPSQAAQIEKAVREFWRTGKRN